MILSSLLSCCQRKPSGNKATLPLDLREGLVGGSNEALLSSRSYQWRVIGEQELPPHHDEDTASSVSRGQVGNIDFYLHLGAKGILSCPLLEQCQWKPMVTEALNKIQSLVT